MVEIRAYADGDEDAVVELWAEAGVAVPWNDPRKDIARKLADGADELLVAVEGERVMGTAMAGYDGHRGWIYYLAVRADRRNQGIGRRLVAACEVILAGRGCPKVNLMVRADNPEAVGFYARVGYEASDVVTLGKRLEPDG